MRKVHRYLLFLAIALTLIRFLATPSLLSSLHWPHEEDPQSAAQNMEFDSEFLPVFMKRYFDPFLYLSECPAPALYLQQTDLMLRIVADALEESGITYWLDSGTLLGAYRFHAHQPFEDDVDLIVDIDAFVERMDQFQTALATTFARYKKTHPHLVEGYYLDPLRLSSNRDVYEKYIGQIYMKYNGGGSATQLSAKNDDESSSFDGSRSGGNISDAGETEPKSEKASTGDPLGRNIDPTLTPQVDLLPMRYDIETDRFHLVTEYFRLQVPDGIPRRMIFHSSVPPPGTKENPALFESAQRFWPTKLKALKGNPRQQQLGALPILGRLYPAPVDVEGYSIQWYGKPHITMMSTLKMARMHRPSSSCEHQVHVARKKDLEKFLPAVIEFMNRTFFDIHGEYSWSSCPLCRMEILENYTFSPAPLQQAVATSPPPPPLSALRLAKV